MEQSSKKKNQKDNPPSQSIEKRTHFGELLRQCREKAGYSIDRVAVATKISYPFIEALESGEFQKLPAEVFGRGFIRNLCKVYNEDPKPLLIAYNEAININGLVSHHTESDRLKPMVKQNSRLFPSIGLSRRFIFTKPIQRLRSSPGPLMIMTVTLVFSSMILGWWMYRNISGKSIIPSQAKVEKKSSRNFDGVTVAPLPKPETIKSEPLSETMTEGKAEKAGVQDDADSETEALEDQALAPDMHWIELTVTETVKVMIERDGQGVISETLSPESYQYRFKEEMLLFVENSGAVKVSFNGKSLGTLGNQGVPKRMTFKSEQLGAL